MRYYRIEGIVYPAGGMIDGGTMPTRTREECIAFFGRGDRPDMRNYSGSGGSACPQWRDFP
jgi:hypothetical protein